MLAGPRRVINRVSDIAGYISSLAVFVAAVIITYEVIFRYLYNRPTVWEIEAAVFMLIFAGFMSAGYGLKSDSHIKIELLTIRLKPRPKAFLTIITDSVSFLFCAALTYKAWPMWWEAWDLGWVSESLWSPPLWVPYLFLPIGCTILSFQYLVRIGQSVQAYRELIKPGPVNKPL